MDGLLCAVFDRFSSRGGSRSLEQSSEWGGIVSDGGTWPRGPNAVGVRDRCVRKIDGGVQTCVAGSRIQGYVDAPGAKAKFVWLQSLIVTSDGTRAFMADGGNARIRWIDLTDAAYPVARLAPLTGARCDWFFDIPRCLVWDKCALVDTAFFVGCVKAVQYALPPISATAIHRHLMGCIELDRLSLIRDIWLIICQYVERDTFKIHPPRFGRRGQMNSYRST